MGSVSNQDCIRTGRLAKCDYNQGSCQNTVRINHGRLQITKGCKQTQACENNMRQNSVVGTVDKKMKKWGVHTQCSFSWQQTTCRCCCSSDRCNSRPLYCISDKDQDEFDKLIGSPVKPAPEGKKYQEPVDTGSERARPQAHTNHPCTWNPGNGAECIKLSGSKYKCKCQPGWRDSHCNTPISRRARTRLRIKEVSQKFLRMVGIE